MSGGDAPDCGAACSEAACPEAAARLTGDERRRWERRAIVLVVATLAWNAVEAVVAVAAGVSAGSIALVGFGLDSVIEGVAAVALLWRLSVEWRHGTERGERAERLVLRVVGATFVLLAAYVLIEAGLTLWQREPPAESLVGIVLAAASLVVMPLVAVAKLDAARRLGSRSLAAEAKETLACAWLSLALLVGLAANALAGWWQADPVVALAMVPWLLREGLEGLRAEGCC